MTWIALLARLLLAGVFSIAAAAKLADRAGFRQALLDFGVPERLSGPGAVVVPLLELGTAVLLLPGVTARWGAFAALTLLVLFTTGVLANLARGRRPRCNCFGQIRSRPIGWPTVARNVALACMAATIVRPGGEAPLAMLLPRLGSPAMTALVFGIALIGLVLSAVEAWFILRLLPQQGRLLIRLEAIENRLGLSGSGLHIGEPAPDFELPSLDGDRVSLSALRAAGRPVLLFFTNPHCTPCDALLPEVARRQREHGDRLSIAVIAVGTAEENRPKADRHALRRVLLQKDREVQDAYEDATTPAAVLIAPDGTIASRLAFGATAVTELMERALNGAAGPSLRLVTGPAAPEPSAIQARPAPPAIGQAAPAAQLRDLDGRAVSILGEVTRPTLLLFWSPSCGFCRHMLPDIKAWERERSARAAELLVISRGTAEENRALGFRSRVLLDPGDTAMMGFGATGTPSAILVDEEGRIASPLAMGADRVMALARSAARRPARA